MEFPYRNRNAERATGRLVSGTGLPPNDIGFNGDFYIDTTSNTLYGPKKNNFWNHMPLSLTGGAGVKGESGDSGSHGPPGTQFSYGPEEPIDGSNGDYYFQLDNEDRISLLYGPKTSEGWGDGMLFSGVSNDDNGNLFPDGTFVPIASLIRPILISADGNIQIIMTYGYIDGYILTGKYYISRNAGQTFDELNIESEGYYAYYNNFYSMSPDGKYIMIYMSTYDTNIVFTSSNEGATFVSYTFSYSGPITGISLPVIDNQPYYTLMIDKYNDNPAIIYVSEDGLTWDSYDVIMEDEYNDIRQFTESRNGSVMFIVTNSMPNDRLYKSTDYGNNWEYISIDTEPYSTYIRELIVSYDGNHVAFINSYYNIFVSSDGGENFIMVDKEQFPSEETEFTRLTMSLDGQQLFVFGSTYNIYLDELYCSSDGGITWHRYYEFDNVYQDMFYIVSGYTNTIMMYNDYLVSSPIVIDEGVIVPSPDFQRVEINGEYAMTIWKDVAMSIDGQIRAAVTYYGHIYVSVDFGETWISKKVFLYINNDLNVIVDMDNTGQYIMCGNNDTIYLSDDEGENWIYIPFTAYPNYYLVNFVIRGEVVAEANEIFALFIMQIEYDEYDRVFFMQYDKTFIEKTLPDAGTLYSISMSDDAMFITVVAENGVYVYDYLEQEFINIFPISTDDDNSHPQNQMKIIEDGDLHFDQVSISSSGRYQMIGGTKLFVSNDFGQSWHQPKNIPDEMRNFYSINVSASGKYQFFSIAIDSNKIIIYKSSNYGQDFHESYILNTDYVYPENNRMAVSSDARHIAFVSSSLFDIYQLKSATILNTVVPDEDARANIGGLNKRYRSMYFYEGSFQQDPVITSDIRFKKDIRDIKLGSEFIKSIRPVKYAYTDNIDDQNKIHYGVIAQELRDILIKAGMNDSGIYEENEGQYSVRYTELIAPLIKAHQELLELVDEQYNEIESLYTRIKGLNGN